MNAETARAASSQIADLMTVEDIHKETGIPKDTIRWWRHVGRGPVTFKLGRRVMCRREDFEAWLSDAYGATANNQRPA